MSTTTTEKTYEMMWDCQYCQQKKLLGLTHRFCPNCGAPQDPARRYFPPDHERVAVQDHQFVGADVQCPACRNPMSRACVHCSQCGSPIAGGKSVGLRQEGAPYPGQFPGQSQMPGQGQYPGQAASPPAKKSGVGWIVALVVVALIGIIGFRACAKKDATVTVTRHGWTREIEVERFEEVEEKGACSSMPGDARVKSRAKGETVCTKKKVDNGDGTFKEKQECTTAPEQCTYGVNKWHEVRTAKSSGGPNEEPKWPATSVTNTGNCRGCEREGKRTETYTVYFTDDASKKELSCDMNNASKWKGYQDGERYKAKIYSLGGDLDCGSLQKM